MIDRTISTAVVIFDDEITQESITKLISSIELMFNEGFDKVNLYFSSIGGMADFGYLLIDYLNDNVDRINLKIFDSIYSSGLDVAIYSKCPKEVLRGTIIMFHKCLMEDGKIREIDRIGWSASWAINESNKIEDNKLLNDLKQYLTSNEIKLFEEGKDVFIIDEKRIKKIIAG